MSPEKPHPEANSLGGIIKRVPVRLLPKNALVQFADPSTRPAFESTFGTISEDARRQLLWMVGLKKAAEANNLEKVRNFAGQAAVATGKAWAVVSVGPSPWDGVACALNSGLSSADSLSPRPVVWQRQESQLVPALLCSDASQALFARALFDIGGKWGMGTCAHCGTPFIATRSNQSYCDDNCRTNAAMRRYRTRLATRKTLVKRRQRNTN